MSNNKMLATIPEIPGNTDPKLRMVLVAIKEALESRLGRRGDPLDEMVTKRDLTDAKLIEVNARGVVTGVGSAVGGGAGGGSLFDSTPGSAGPGRALSDLGEFPTLPTSFTAEGVFGAVILTWDLPRFEYRGHLHTEIWRASRDNQSEASMVGISLTGMYVDSMTMSGEATYWYWVRHVSVNGTIGVFSESRMATKPEDVGELLTRLSGEIDETILAQALAERIGLIDADITVPGSVAARVNTERLERVAADESLAKRVDIVQAATGDNSAALVAEQQARTTADEALGKRVDTVVAKADDTLAAIQTEQEARATADTALAQQIDTVLAKVNTTTAAVQTETEARVNADGALAKQISTVQTAVEGNVASIQSHASTLNGLSAQYTLKLDVNGYVSGFGAYNNGTKSDMAVVADNFWIAPPNSTNKVKPFIVQDGKVYMETAVIKDASIQSGKLGPISFGKVVDANGTPVTTLAGKLKASYIEADSIVSNYLNTNTGFITTGHIKNLAVDTLKIAGNAITVPVQVEANRPITGTSSWQTVLTAVVTTTAGGWLYAATSGYVSYSNGWGFSRSRLVIAGMEVSEGGGAEAWVTTSHSGARWVEAGTHYVTLQFSSTSGKGVINTRSLFAMLVKR